MLTDEQAQFAQMLDRFVRQEYAGSLNDRIVDRARLSRAAEMGCLSLAVPEDQGGFGGAVETMLMMQILAPALPKEPIFASGVHAAALLGAALPSEIAAEMLPSLADGRLIVAPALAEAGQRYRVDQVATVDRRDGDDWVIDGEKHLVVHAAHADALILSARIGREGPLALFRVDKGTDGVALTERQRIDALPCADIVFARCRLPGSSLIAQANVAAAIAAANDRAEAAQVAEMVGLMDALIGETIAYLRIRKQFGSEIGRFQALQHRVADMWIACEEARSLALAAALSCTEPDDVRRRAVSMAKLHACDTAQRVAADAVQMHGGIGVTDELIVGHWFKRLLALRADLGDRRFHMDRLIGDGQC